MMHTLGKAAIARPLCFAAPRKQSPSKPHAREPPLHRSPLQRPHRCPERGRSRRRVARSQPLQALLSAEGVFSAATYAVMPVYAAILAAPRSKLTKTIVAPPFLFMLFALLYASVLPQVAAIPQILDGLFVKGSFLPQINAMAALFEHEAVVAMAWVHLLMLDLFQARYVLLDGLRRAVPIQHSVILSFMFGPTGLICHLVTVYLFTHWRRQQAAA